MILSYSETNNQKSRNVKSNTDSMIYYGETAPNVFHSIFAKTKKNPTILGITYCFLAEFLTAFISNHISRTKCYTIRSTRVSVQC